jgi:diguanylate cyclase (GGDEF)-like protein
MNFRIKYEHTLFIALASAAMFVLFLLGLSLSHIFTQLERGNYVQRLIQHRINLQSIERRVFEAETAQRAYAMTGVQIYKDEFLTFRDDLLQRIQRIELTGLESDEQTARADKMNSLIRDRIALMNDLVDTRERIGFEAARDIVASGQGKVLTDQIRKIMDEVNNTQVATIQQMQADEISAAGRQTWILSAFALLNITLMAGALYGYHREYHAGRQTVKKLQESSRLNAIVIELNNGLQSCSSLNDAEHIISYFMKELFPYQSGALYVMRSSRNILELKVNWGDGQGHERIIEPKDCWGLRLGKVHLVSENSLKLKCKHYPNSERCSLCIPMMAEGEAIGLLHFSLEEEARQGVSQLLVQENAEIIASHIGPALASLTLREQLKLQSVRDGLTGLYNRRFLEESITREIHRAERSKAGFGLIMMDLDFFKQLNDKYGHQAGDEVLMKFALFLKDQVRGEDIACRYGGDEFALVMPGASLADTNARAQRICQNIKNISMKFHGQVLPNLTVSVGVAACPAHGTVWDVILRAADVALYKAKQEGRDRVIVADILEGGEDANAGALN